MAREENNFARESYARLLFPPLSLLLPLFKLSVHISIAKCRIKRRTEQWTTFTIVPDRHYRARRVAQIYTRLKLSTVPLRRREYDVYTRLRNCATRAHLKWKELLSLLKRTRENVNDFIYTLPRVYARHFIGKKNKNLKCRKSRKD